MAKNTSLDQTRRLMTALVRMKPKPHEEMKIGKLAKKRRLESKRKSKKDS